MYIKQTKPFYQGMSSSWSTWPNPGLDSCKCSSSLYLEHSFSDNLEDFTPKLQE